MLKLNVNGVGGVRPKKYWNQSIDEQTESDTGSGDSLPTTPKNNGQDANLPSTNLKFGSPLNSGKSLEYVNRDRKLSQSTMKPVSSYTSLQPIKKKTAFVIKSPCVFEAASKDILMKLAQDGELSIDIAISLISKYEMASETVENHFPGARPSRKILSQVKDELKKYNILPENTLFAQSICPDEINHMNGGIGDIFTEYFGDCFHLGGLAGIPFTGATGFTAFSHHVPDGGNLFILFAAHIGLSESYKFGQYSRRGQSNEGSACGAAVGALNHCIACKPIPTYQSLGANPYDYQMNYIISQVTEKLHTIKTKETENEKQAELAKQMFEISKEFLNRIVTLNFGSKFSNLILLGGVQINMPGPQTDFFQPLFFEIRHRDRSSSSPPVSTTTSSSSSLNSNSASIDPSTGDNCDDSHDTGTLNATTTTNNITSTAATTTSTTSSTATTTTATTVSAAISPSFCNSTSSTPPPNTNSITAARSDVSIDLMAAFVHKPSASGSARRYSF